MTILELIQSFTQSCVGGTLKELSRLLKELPNKDLQGFFNAKPVKGQPKLSDEERFEQLITYMCVQVGDQLNSTLLDPERFKTILPTVLKHDSVREGFRKSVTLLKTAIGRLLNPKDDDDDDGESPLDSLKETILPYSVTFLEELSTIYAISGGQCYHRHIERIDADPDYSTMIDAVIPLMQNLIFSFIVDDVDLYVLNASNVSDDLLSPVQFEQVWDYLRIGRNLTPNPIYYTTLDTVKRKFFNADQSPQEFMKYLQLLMSLSPVYQTCGRYLRSDDFPTDPDQLNNTVMCFPKAFEDHAKWALTIFVFDLEVNPHTLMSYWLTTRPIPELLDSFDQEAFEWSDTDYFTSGKCFNQSTQRQVYLN